ncbi:MAG TPA: hypothetical protein VFR11_00845 [Micromonosporaceae bacterium]|jgi:hypothetical protein|nr:hypothetical protein [Micromonosporaceae bacterium]
MSGQTNWTPYDVPLLAGILNEDLSGAWDQVGAWFSAQAMLDDASSKLQDARDGLAVVWPPEKSPTAAVFFRLVDRLTESMKTTSLASNANGNALYHVLTNQDATKAEVDRLHSTWSTYQRLGAADQQDIPDATEWQGALNRQAQQHMATADEVINEYAATLVVPQVVPMPFTSDVGALVSGSDGGPLHPSASPADANLPPSGVGPPNVTTPEQGTPVLTGLEGLRLPAPQPTQVQDLTQAQALAEPAGHSREPESDATNQLVEARNLAAASDQSATAERRGTQPAADGAQGRLRSINDVLTRPESSARSSIGDTVVGPAADRTEIAGSGLGFVGAAPGAAAIDETRGNAANRLRRPNSASRVGSAEKSLGLGTVIGRDGTIRPAQTASEHANGPAASTIPVPRQARPGFGRLTGGVDGRPRTTFADTIWDMPVGVPAVLAASHETSTHDPGPGVIGIDR